MVTVVVKKDAVIVTRSLDLPGIKPPMGRIFQPYKVEVDFKGLAAGSEIEKEVLSEFKSRFKKVISADCKKENNSLIADWNKEVEKISAGRTAKAREKLAAAAEKKIHAVWGDFYEKTLKTQAPLVLDKVAEDVFKKHDTVLKKKPKLKFFSKENTKNRESMLLGLLAVVSMAANPALALSVFVLGGGKALVEAITGALKSAQARSKDIADSLGIIEDTLSKSHSLLTGLNKEKARIEQCRRAANANIFMMTRNLKNLKEELAEAAKSDAKDGNDVDFKSVNAAEKAIKVIEDAIPEAKSIVDKEKAIQAALKDATKAVEKARAIAATEKTALRKIANAFDASSGDLKNGFGTLKKLFRGFGG